MNANSVSRSALRPFSVVAMLLLIGAFAWEIAASNSQWAALLSYAFTGLRSIGVTLLVPALALLLGFSALRGKAPSLSLALSLGWGILSLILFFLAAIGSLLGASLFVSWMPPALIAASAILLRGQLIALARVLRERFVGLTRERVCLSTALLAVVVVLVCIRLLLTALTPSFLYDVLEYHLPDARHLIDTGSLTPIPGNVYSMMPQAVEIVFAFGRLLEGNLASFAPKLIHLYLAFSTLLVLNFLLRQLAVGRQLRLFAALLFLCHVITFKRSLDAYIDMGVALFTTAAVASWLRAWQRPDSLHLPLAAVFLGFALSCKYPVLAIGVIPFLLFLATFAPTECLPFKRRSLGLPILALVVFLTYSPWLLRALVIDHSSFPPMTLPWRGGDAEHRAIRAFMSEAHKPQPPFSADYWAAVWARIPHVGALLFVAPVLMLFRQRLDRALALFALAGYLAWNTRMDSSDRFLAPLLPVFIALAALMLSRLSRWAVLPFAAWLLVLLYTQAVQAEFSGWVAAGLGAMDRREFLEKQLDSPAKFFEAVNKATDQTTNPRTLLLYEARAAAFKAPSVSNTVFDACSLWMLLRTPIGESPEAVVQELRKQGITHIAVNEVELARLLKTYPVAEARNDPAFGQPDSKESLRALRKYYPPFYYFSQSNSAAIEARLDRFLEHVRSRAAWEDDARGLRVWVAKIAP